MKTILILLISISIISCSSNSNNKGGEEISGIKEEVLTKKKFLNRPAYNVSYPYNWYIDSTDSDFDIDSYFSLDSPTEGCFAEFLFFNTSMNEKELLDEQIKEHLKVSIKNGTVTYFNKWGEYSGQGASIKGKMVGIFKGELKLFVHSTDSSTFFIFSQLLDDDRLKDESGLRLIENSFKVK
jgi:hypothetical protein